MMRIDPSILVRRMVISRGGQSAYDENFHDGVNIIRGDNSSGKSTILNFLFYGLGGDLSEWSDIALLCEFVFLEVEFNGKVFTLRRAVAAKTGQPMDIFGGDFEAAIAAPISAWIRFPYRRSANKESFSQAIFRALEIPEAANDETGNITIHQVLRLLYADQLSPVDSLFRFEPFDNAVIRTEVAKLLCGAFDNELYENGVEIRNLEKRHDSARAELSSLYKATSQAGHDLTLDWVGEQRARIAQERTDIGNKIVEIEQISRESQIDKPSLTAQNEAYQRLVSVQLQLAEISRIRDSLEFEIADSETFIASLQAKLDSIRDAELTAEVFGHISFDSCPACYAPVAAMTSLICPLCKSPFDPQEAAERLSAQMNDIAIQLRQSKLLQENRLERVAAARTQHQDLLSDWRIASERLSEVSRRLSTEHETKLRELNRAMGYLERREEDLGEKARLIEVIQALASTTAQLRSRLSDLKSRNEQLEFARASRLSLAYSSIEEEVRRLLLGDLKREDAFDNPGKVEIDFSGDRIGVDGKTYFSASSRVILKSSFFLGFHAAACKHGFFRHPRFSIIDTIEDKGMEQIRSHNFQRLIVETVKAAPCRNQIIFATAMIAPELNDESLTVGKFYTREARSLSLT